MGLGGLKRPSTFSAPCSRVPISPSSENALPMRHLLIIPAGTRNKRGLRRYFTGWTISTILPSGSLMKRILYL